MLLNHHRSLRVVFARFEWKWHTCLSIKTGDLKISLFIYWNDRVLCSVETYFLEVGAYVFLKRVATGAWEGCIWWNWVKITQVFKCENLGVGPKNSTVYLL